MRIQEILDKTIRYKTINRLIFVSVFIIILLDFIFTDKRYLYFFSIISFLLTIIKLLKIHSFKKRSLAYFRIKAIWSLKGSIHTFIIIVALILFFMYIPMPKKTYSSLSLIVPLIIFSPMFFFSIFIFSIVTYKNGIHINVQMDNPITWQNVDNIELNGKYVIIKISGKLQKYKYHEKDIDDVNVLIKQFSKYNGIKKQNKIEKLKTENQSE